MLRYRCGSSAAGSEAYQDVSDKRSASCRRLNNGTLFIIASILCTASSPSEHVYRIDRIIIKRPLIGRALRVSRLALSSKDDDPGSRMCATYRRNNNICECVRESDLSSSLPFLLSSQTLSRSISERTRARDIPECAFRDPLAAHFGEMSGPAREKETHAAANDPDRYRRCNCSTRDASDVRYNVTAVCR